MALIEVKGKVTKIKTGETDKELECPDKDFTCKSDGEAVIITPTRNMNIKKSQ